MKLLQMKYFQTVCRYGSITKAAEELFVSQPTISFCIKELEEEQMNVEGTLAQVLQQQDELMSFVQRKMDYIGAKINERFKTVKFKLFDKQINGGISEVCEATVNGVPYADLNSGHRIIAGLEIAKAFQDIYNFQCPIFIDNAESLSTENIPKVDGQLILLSVADCDLKVE